MQTTCIDLFSAITCVNNGDLLDPLLSIPQAGNRQAKTPERQDPPKPLIEIDIVRSVISIETSNYEIGLAKLEQLEALMAAASGPGYQPFSALNKRLQENLVMLAADLAQEARRSLAQPTA